MLLKPAILGACIGLTLCALLLTGSLRVAAPSPNSILPPDVAQLRDRGFKLASQGGLYDARTVFLRASARAQELGLQGPAAMSLVNAGSCLYMALSFRGAQADFERARDLARSSRQYAALAAAENNLANLYLHIGARDKALEVARAAIAGPEGRVDRASHAKLLFQEAVALAETNRFPEAEPLYRAVIEDLTDANDLDSAARIEGAYGAELLKAGPGRLDDAEQVLSQALWLVRIHHLNASANILVSLAELKSRRGDARSAAHLFRAALEAPPNISPSWAIRAREGRFLLDSGDLAGALDDFREARRVALEMRADIVPADQDRIALESSELTWVIEGLVDAGNLQARKTGNHNLLRETFDAAEQDRMWSLRALVPSPNDWRSRLPDHYWELLAQYQSLERTAVAGQSPEADRQIEKLKTELQRIEAASAGDQAAVAPRSALEHAQSVLESDSVLFSFLITKTSGWVWAVDGSNVDVYPLPAPNRIETDADAFSAAVQNGETGNAASEALYRDLFSSVPEKYLSHRRWLIEPDGHLNNVPFARLKPGPAEFLVERVAVESIPGVLLLERGAIPANASFVGIGDPIYNSADPRYPKGSGKPDLTLPRLPNTGDEIKACARAWGSSDAKLLTGVQATIAGVRTALAGNSAIVHFATHVITAPGEFRSGLIALSLDNSGGMGLLGPGEIVARPVTSSLIVMNGCHSAQGRTLPSTGLMGLTRAWIGAGAKAVLATGWDVPDTAAQSLMTDFYRALRASPERGAAFALRQAQLGAIRREANHSPKTQWAAYFLLSRIQ